MNEIPLTTNLLGSSAFSTAQGLGYLIKTFFYLGILGGTMYFILRWLRPKLSITQQKGFIQVLDVKPLGIQSALYLVQTGMKYFLMAQSQKKLELIAEISAKDIHLMERQLDIQKANSVTLPSFQEIWDKIKSKKI